MDASLTARDTALRLVAAAGASDAQRSDAAPGDASMPEHAVRRLCEELVGWFGPFATHALITRALSHARADHQALHEVRAGLPSAPALDGLADSARVHGAAATAAGVVDVIAWIVELLRRLIGNDLATALVEQSVPRRRVDPSVPGERVPGPGADGGRQQDSPRDTGDTRGSTTDD
jgi:hypothetical protein